MGARVPTGVSESNHPASIPTGANAGRLTVSAVLRKMKKWSNDNELYYTAQKRGSKLLKLIAEPAERVP